MNGSSVRWIYVIVGPNMVFWKQAMLSVCSLLARSGGRASIIVYTDEPARYAWMAAHVEIVQLPAHLIAEWIGPERFFFRLKPCLLRHHFACTADHAVFYLDSDTLCTGQPDALETTLLTGALMMHLPEYRVCDDKTKERREYRRRLLNRPLPGGLRLKEDSIMWNAGLLGITRADLPLVETVICAVDEMTRLGLSPRTRLKEQLAFSLAAQDTGRLQAIGDHFTHYWGNKDAWEQWTDGWLMQVLNRQLGPTAAGLAVAEIAPPPPPVAAKRSPAERRKARWRKFLRLD